MPIRNIDPGHGAYQATTSAGTNSRTKFAQEMVVDYQKNEVEVSSREEKYPFGDAPIKPIDPLGFLIELGVGLGLPFWEKAFLKLVFKQEINGLVGAIENGVRKAALQKTIDDHYDRIREPLYRAAENAAVDRWEHRERMRDIDGGKERANV